MWNFIPSWLRPKDKPVDAPDPRAAMRDDLRGYLQSKNVLAFLRLIRAGESSQQPDAYTILFGGDHFTTGFARHPNIKVSKSGYTSTAAGAYQFLYRTWASLAAQYGFPDFSPENQDLGAIALLKGRNALDDVMAGRLDVALPKAGREWASLPGSPYGQPMMTMSKARQVFASYGGSERFHIGGNA